MGEKDDAAKDVEVKRRKAASPTDQEVKRRKAEFNRCMQQLNKTKQHYATVTTDARELQQTVVESPAWKWANNKEAMADLVQAIAAVKALVGGRRPGPPHDGAPEAQEGLPGRGARESGGPVLHRLRGTLGRAGVPDPATGNMHRARPTRRA